MCSSDLDLVSLSSERVLLALNLDSGAVRTIYVRLRGALEPEEIETAQQTLNQRLAGLTLREIRATFAERLRDVSVGAAAQLLDIVLAESETLFDTHADQAVVLGSARPLADQPEFASSERMRTLLDLTEQRDVLRDALASRKRDGVTITIGGEHAEPGLAPFTLVTSTYRRGDATCVIGVLGQIGRASCRERV